MKIAPEVSSFHIQQLVKWLKKSNNKQDAVIQKKRGNKWLTKGG